MTDVKNPDPSGRGLAAAFAACAIAMIGLLASHPDDGAHSFADFLRNEADHRVIDGLVHGGFIATLAASIVCFVLLARRLGASTVPVVMGLVSFCIGAAGLMASMLLDGFASPAVAVRFAGHPESLEAARSIFVLLGAVIGALMPMGLLFLSTAMLCWSVAVARGDGVRRFVGFGAGVVGATLIVGLFAAPASLAMVVLMGAIALQAAWQLALAVLLAKRAL